MLTFYSGATRMANSVNAAEECISLAANGTQIDPKLVFLHASMGHNLLDLSRHLKMRFPQARIVGTSCAGLVGRNMVTETMMDVGLMLVEGDDFAVGHVNGISGANSFEYGQKLAEILKSQRSGINMIYLLAPGIDVSNDRLIAGIESVLGDEITVFGGTSSDNVRGKQTYQVVDDALFSRAVFAVGFADPSLSVRTMATHGFVAVEPALIVTKSQGNRIIELNGVPAWKAYTAQMLLPDTAELSDTMPIGALAEELSPEEAAKYGNKHILRVVTHTDDTGSLIYPVDIKVGTKLWLTVRDEDLIFADVERMVKDLLAASAYKKPIAVFSSDCVTRGRRLFNRIVKEELVYKMQYPLSTNDITPPWLGLYGFGEYARINGANRYQAYTTALAAICRD